MKAKDLRERSTEDLAELKTSIEKDLFSHRMKNATDQLGDTSLLGKARKDIARGRKTVLERTWKSRFRRPPVVDGDDDRAGLDREQSRLPVVGFEVAGDPAAAVEKHHGR